MTIKCPYCKRDDFKSEGGLVQHINRSLACSEQRDLEHSQALSPEGQQNRVWLRNADLGAPAVLEGHSLGGLGGVRDLQEDVEMEAAEAGSEAGSVNDPDSEGELMVITEGGKEVLGTVASSDGEDDNPDGEDDNPDGEAENSDLSDEEADSAEEPLDELDVEADEVDGNADGTSQDEDDAGPIKRLRDKFVKFADPKKFFAPLSPADEAGVKLMDVLHRKKAPLNSYKEVYEWHLKEAGRLSEGENLQDAGEHFIGRKPLLEKLVRRSNMAGYKPYVRRVQLPSSKQVVDIVCHDAGEAIVQLLSDPRIKDEDYCFFHDDPLAPPPDNNKIISECITGSAYDKAYKELITAKNQQLVGTIFYIDAAATGQFSHLPVTPLKLSLSIFTMEARKREHMWVTLGYVPEIRLQEAKGKEIYEESKHMDAEDMNPEGRGEVEVEKDDEEAGFSEVKAQDFHKILDVLLESYVKVQNRGMIWDLVYKRTIYRNWHMVFFTPFVRADTEEADTLCGKFTARTAGVKQICRYCKIPTDKADDHRANYPEKTQEEIEKLYNSGKEDKLHEMSQRNVKNAFYKIRFSDTRIGIHGATPSEMLHAILLGLFMYTRNIFFLHVGKDSQLANDLNGLAKIYGKLLTHQSDRSMPKTNFTKGIKEGKLMAKEYRGVLLLIAVILRSTKGSEMLSKKKTFKEKGLQEDWLMLVQLLLEWEAYLCEPQMQKSHVHRLKKKHQSLLYILKRVAPRKKRGYGEVEGMGFKIFKFHAVLHLALDILRYGVPSEFDTGPNESHLKAAKAAAKMTQKLEANFNIQTGLRLWEFRTVHLALEEILHAATVRDYFADAVREIDLLTIDEDQEEGFLDQEVSSEDQEHAEPMEQDELPEEEEQEILTDGSKIRVFWDEEGEESFQMLSRSHWAAHTRMNTDLLKFLVALQDKVSDRISQNELQIFTRHKRGKQIFRGHPNFMGQGAWRDWVLVDWGREWGKLPCHIACFVELDGNDWPTRGSSKIEHGGIVLGKGVYAVVEVASYVEEAKEDEVGTLFTTCRKEVATLSDDKKEVKARTFYLADTEAFVEPLSVVPDIGGAPNMYFQVRPRRLWAGEFIKWIEAPHTKDEISDEEDEEAEEEVDKNDEESAEDHQA